MLSGAQAGLIVAAAGILIGLIFVIFGAVRLGRRVEALRKRLDAYAELPVMRSFALVEARVAIAERALAQLPDLQLRAVAAFAEIDQARRRIVSSLFTWSTGARILVSLLVD